MISLNNGSSTGSICPVCDNSSVFSDKIYKWIGLVYSHTITKCYMPSCNYSSDVCTRKVLIEKYKHKERSVITTYETPKTHLIIRLKAGLYKE